MSGPEDVVLDVRGLTQTYTVGRRTLSAVDDVTFQVRRGETLGLVGESGCGKSTTARSILQAPAPTSGEVLFGGEDLCRLRGSRLRRLRSRMQMVFQDPFSSLNPTWRVEDLVAEPLEINEGGRRRAHRARAQQLLELVGLDPAQFADRRPRELSGGQAQRVGIARALAVRPDLVICDEAVSSLDVSIQAQVLNLFEQLRQQLRLTYIFIAHDLGVVKSISDRVGVMYLGRIVELGPVADLYARPAHPYTAALLSAVPEPGISRRARIPLDGELPSALDPPSGCRFRTRCPRAEQRCADDRPLLRPVGPGRSVACHFPLVEVE